MRITRNIIITAFGMTAILGCSGMDTVILDETAGADGMSSSRGAADFEIRDGQVLTEGDIILGTVEEVFGGAVDASGSVEKSAGAFSITGGFTGTGKTTAWTNAEIRWRFDAAFDATSSAADAERRDEIEADFREAVRHFRDRTTLRFTEITGTSGNYVDVSRSNACRAAVGMNGNAQSLKIGRTDTDGNRTCNLGSIIHEVGHATGLHHEHQRTDRDTYVDVPAKPSTAVLPADQITPLSDYEVTSIMHYAKDVTYAGTSTPVPANRTALTYFDIQGIQLMYGDQLSPLAGVSQRTDKIDIFYRSSTGKVDHRYFRSGTWRPGSSRGAPNDTVIMGAPVAISRDGTQIDLLVLGQDERIYHQSYDGTSWSAWAAIGTDTFRSQPAAVSRSLNTINVFAVDKATGALKHNSYYGTSWSGWSSLGGVVVGTPSVAAIDSNHVDVFVLDTNKRLRRKSWSNTAGWDSSFANLGGTFRGVVTAVEIFPNRIELFGKNTASKLVHRAYFPLTGTFNTSGWVKLSELVVIGNPQVVGGFFANDLRVVVTGSDRQLYEGTMSASASSITFESLAGTLEGSPLLVHKGKTIYAFGRATDDSIRYKSVTDGLLHTWSSSYSHTGATVSW